MEHIALPMYPLEDKQLTREEVRIIVAEAHVWQKRADLRRADLRQTNLIGADLREADLEGANLVSRGLPDQLIGYLRMPCHLPVRSAPLWQVFNRLSLGACGVIM